MKKVLVLIVSMLVCCSWAYAGYCDNVACTYQGSLDAIHDYEAKTGKKFPSVMYGDTASDHVEFDIVHKNGIKEHCYQTMDVFPIQCH
ncbi:MAG: hypothetical protein SPK70_10110 [Succinivibrio dextrinosolvens]|nr:hypothetical protein [Succinivibrio dextrinosolvens]MDY6420835.1 hypothetical protein [Succinivibrio dextrinosolvens]MDY6466397.1 hypothetical protein [Succinivibrio dextrinosolvens]MDY6471408.1 hypothetical protein [Succinivibrio dextrinosolvens]